VLEDQGVEEGLGGLLFVLVEGGEGLELEPELLVGAALVLLEDEGVGGDPEAAGELAAAVVGAWAAPASLRWIWMRERSTSSARACWVRPRASGGVARPGHRVSRCDSWQAISKPIY
jgi:hypothetical protein